MRKIISNWVATGLLVLAISLASPRESPAKIYKYVDSNGVTVFVDDESKIPVEYRQNLKIYKEELDHLSPGEREAILDQRRQEQETEQSRIRGEKEESAREAARQAYLKSLETPVVIRGNQVLVPVQVGYGGRQVKLQMLLDTGASHTLFHRSAVERLEFRNANAVYGRVAGGGIVQAEKVKLGYVQVGPFRKEGMTAMVMDTTGPALQFDGLLGMDFLKNLDYQIDYERSIMRWNR